MPATLQLTNKEMTDAEWRTRCDLAALYRVVHYLGWTDLINTHLSARIPGEPEAFLINRYGEMFDEITGSSLIKMDMGGNVLGADGQFQLRHAHAHPGRRRRLVATARTSPDQPGRAACAGRHRLSPVRSAGDRGGM